MRPRLTLAAVMCLASSASAIVSQGRVWPFLALAGALFVGAFALLRTVRS